MKTRLAMLVMCLSLLITSSRAFALDPGTVTGTLMVDGATVNLTHAYAHLHDNAEGWLDLKREMRILVTDRAVTQETIAGLNPFFELTDLVKKGSLRGVFIRFDPATPNSILATVLSPPKDERFSLTNKTISDSEQSPLGKLVVSDTRVSASVSQKSDGNPDFGWPAESYTFSFSAPLTKEPAVTATLKGKQALNSPQVKAVLARAAAMSKGDLDKTKKLCTERSAREIDGFMAQSKEEAMKMMREGGKEIEKSVKKGALTLIVRGESATLVIKEKESGTMFGLQRKNGAWLVD